MVTIFFIFEKNKERKERKRCMAYASPQIVVKRESNTKKVTKKQKKNGG